MAAALKLKMSKSQLHYEVSNGCLYWIRHRDANSSQQEKPTNGGTKATDVLLTNVLARKP